MTCPAGCVHHACTCAEACPLQVPGYTSLKGVDHDGDDIGSMGTPLNKTGGAIEKCNADINCKGLNDGGWYKTAVWPTQASPRGASGCLYIKRE